MPAADPEADAMQTDPRDERIAVLERRLQEAEQRRHQSHDALTMRIAALESALHTQAIVIGHQNSKIAALEAQGSRNPNLDEMERRLMLDPRGPTASVSAPDRGPLRLEEMGWNIVDTRERFAYGVLRSLREPGSPDLQYRRLLPPPKFAEAPMYQHQEVRNHIAPIGYIADHFNEPDPTQPAGPGRRIGWLYVSDELMEKPDLMERLLAGGTVLRRKRRGSDYGLLIERDEFEPYEGDEDSAPLYTATVDSYSGVEWQRA